MKRQLFTAIALSFTLLPALGAQEVPETKRPINTNYSAITRDVNALLRDSKKVVRLDHERDSGVTSLRKEANRITFNSSVQENRLTSIVIEPMGKETPDTAVLAGAFLSALSAVSNPEEGAALAHLVTAENEKDGRPRSVTLRNGVKLMKYKVQEASPRFVITI